MKAMMILELLGLSFESSDMMMILTDVRIMGMALQAERLVL